MSRTGSNPHLIIQNLHSMGSILYVPEIRGLYGLHFASVLITTQSNKVGVVSGYINLITFGY